MNWKDLNMILCDWNKAFDRVNVEVLEEALVAFGIQGNFLKAIKSTFTSRFRVLGVGGFESSDYYPQETGIRQGCPMSPLLFVVMLSWLVEWGGSPLCPTGHSPATPSSH